jgi:hypothetical protein
MTNHSEINELIRNRRLYPGFEEQTYFTQELYDLAADHYDDPLILFKIKVYGYYQRKYKWTKEQADWFIAQNAEHAISHSDGIQEYVYDWGRGKNKLTQDMMHEPNLDHIDPVSKSKNNDPSNFRIRCARLNENKGNMSTDNERRAVIIDTFLDMSPDARALILEHLGSIMDQKTVDEA